MEISIHNTHENKLIKRKEILFKVAYIAAPPKRVEVRDALAKSLGVEPNLVIIKRLDNDFGSRTMDCISNVYMDEPTLKKFEAKHLIARSKGEKLKKEPKVKAAPAKK